MINAGVWDLRFLQNPVKNSTVSERWMINAGVWDLWFLQNPIKNSTVSERWMRPGANFNLRSETQSCEKFSSDFSQPLHFKLL